MRSSHERYDTGFKVKSVLDGLHERQHVSTPHDASGGRAKIGAVAGVQMSAAVIESSDRAVHYPAPPHVTFSFAAIFLSRPGDADKVLAAFRHGVQWVLPVRFRMALHEGLLFSVAQSY